MGAAPAVVAPRLTGRVEIGVLAHLALDFLPLFLVVEHHLAVAEVAAFDSLLRFAEEGVEAFEGADGFGAAAFEAFGSFWAEAA